MMESSTFKTIETITETMNILTMIHKTFDKNAKFIGNVSVKLAIKVLEFNAKLKKQLL
jgi:hypothetical protein